MDRRTLWRTVYNTRRWRTLRAAQLESQPLCACCPTTEPATIVHHITPIRAGGDPWDAANLESLCQSCHNAIHNAPVPVDPEVRRWHERLGWV